MNQEFEISLRPRPRRVPALLFAGLWFFTQVVQGVGTLAMPAGSGGIAWWAHIGGFVAGWVLIRRLSPAANPIEETHAAARRT